MTEDEARDWLAGRCSPKAVEQLERFAQLLTDASAEQSLIAASTLPSVWSRHIVDSAQLVDLAPSIGSWLDIGSGAGLPGIVVAILRDAPMVLSEPRRKRAAFLTDVVAALELGNVTVAPVKVQNISPATFSVVSARAVASIGDIFAWNKAFVSRETQFVLPRGQLWNSELEIARRAWHGRFHVEQSITDPNSGIVIASGVAQR